MCINSEFSTWLVFLWVTARIDLQQQRRATLKLHLKVGLQEQLPMSAKMDDHGHSDEEISSRISKAHENSLLRDFVYGAIDGTITTFAIISGTAGAGLSQGIIIALGLANVLADGFSMAASNYLGTRSEVQNHRRIIATEERHIDKYHDGEKAELKQILSRHGLNGRDLQQVCDIVSCYKSLWIELMLSGEYGLPPFEPRPLASAVATFLAFIACGFIPLLPFIFFPEHAYVVATLLTGVTFFTVGAIKSKWAIESWFYSAFQTLLIGGIAATIAYSVGKNFSAGV